MLEILEYCRQHNCSIQFNFDIINQIQVVIFKKEPDARYEQCISWNHIDSLFDVVKYCVEQAIKEGEITRPIIELPLNTRTYFLLKSVRIENLAEVMTYSSRQLLLIRGFGQGSLKEIVKLLAKYGKKLREE